MKSLPSIETLSLSSPAPAPVPKEPFTSAYARLFTPIEHPEVLEGVSELDEMSKSGKRSISGRDDEIEEYERDRVLQDIDHLSLTTPPPRRRRIVTRQPPAPRFQTLDAKARAAWEDQVRADKMALQERERKFWDGMRVFEREVRMCEGRQWIELGWEEREWSWRRYYEPVVGSKRKSRGSDDDDVVCGRRVEVETGKRRKVLDDEGEKVNLNIGGTHYTVSRTTLLSHPNTLFVRLLASRPHLRATTELFINRNGTHYTHIFNFLRDGNDVILPKRDTHMMECLLREAEHVGLEGLAEKVRWEMGWEDEMRDASAWVCQKIGKSVFATLGSPMCLEEESDEFKRKKEKQRRRQRGVCPRCERRNWYVPAPWDDQWACYVCPRCRHKFW
ncbi:EF-hand domain-containing protein 1 [Rhizophlyctis rosea]|nr:EF-hand domain-containing protein 1 [Rhizophlyctis rosea]